MLKTRQSIVWMLMLVATILSSTSPAQQKPKGPEYAGFINDVKGRCFIQRGGRTKLITKGEYGAARLFVGDKVRCDDRGSLALELTTPTQRALDEPCATCTIIEPSPRNSWTTVPRPSGPRTGPLAGPQDDWNKLAGGQRRPSSSLYSPPSGSNAGAVWPERFVIRWICGDKTGDVSLKIRGESGVPIWPQDNGENVTAPAAPGELISTAVRGALLDYRKAGGRGPLTLMLVDSKGEENEVQFFIISENDEETLRNRLKMCSSQPGLMKYICRAYYLRKLNLYTEAAEEYDAALQDAPDSVDLQLHAIVAQRLTGNYAREQELVRQLPVGTKPPE